MAHGASGRREASAEVVAEILGRVLRERAFAEPLRTEPDRALAEYDLTAAERAAIVGSPDAGQAPSPLDDRPRTATRLV